MIILFFLLPRTSRMGSRQCQYPVHELLCTLHVITETSSLSELWKGSDFVALILVNHLVKAYTYFYFFFSLDFLLTLLGLYNISSSCSQYSACSSMFSLLSCALQSSQSAERGGWDHHLAWYFYGTEEKWFESTFHFPPCNVLIWTGFRYRIIFGQSYEFTLECEHWALYLQSASKIEADI